MPKISVLTPLYNTNPLHLKEMINSVLTQTYQDFEFLLLNDSPDNQELEQIVMSFNDKRIKYLENKKNIGISASRNKLIDLARGEYLAICDHDDISLPTRFEKQVEFLDRHKEVGVVSALCEVFGNGKHVFQKHPEYDWEIKKLLADDCYVAHPAAMVRKSVLTENNITYNEFYSPAEDYKLWADLMGITHFHNIQENLLKYRTFDKNTSVLQQDKMNNAAQNIRSEIRNKYPAYFLEKLSNRIIPCTTSKINKKQYIKLFNIIPLIKIKTKQNISKVYLFNFIPLFKIITK